MPNDLEFETFWDEVLTRSMGSRTVKKSNWEQPEFAKYLRNYILICKEGIIRATWASGLGALPHGFTTFAANTIERQHRLFKSLFDVGCEKFNAAELMAH
eukprot:5796906-Pyramimonas_sp.AAC.1